MTLLSRELILLFCWVTPMSIWSRWESVMAGLVLACKQIWGHVQTCATGVKMADFKYYSLSSSFWKFLFSFFLFAVCRTRHFVKFLQKPPTTWKFFEKSLMVWWFNLMFSGPEHRCFPLNLDWNPKSFSKGKDWNPKSFSEGKCQQKLNVNLEKKYNSLQIYFKIE